MRTVPTTSSATTSSVHAIPRHPTLPLIPPVNLPVLSTVSIHDISLRLALHLAHASIITALLAHTSTRRRSETALRVQHSSPRPVPTARSSTRISTNSTLPLPSLNAKATHRASLLVGIDPPCHAQPPRTATGISPSPIPSRSNTSTRSPKLVVLHHAAAHLTTSIRDSLSSLALNHISTLYHIRNSLIVLTTA